MIDFVFLYPNVYFWRWNSLLLKVLYSLPHNLWGMMLFRKGRKGREGRKGAGTGGWWMPQPLGVFTMFLKCIHLNRTYTHVHRGRWRWKPQPVRLLKISHTIQEVHCGCIITSACCVCKSYFLGGEWITCNIVSDVYILTTGKKGINAERNENVKLTHTQVFCGRLCVLCE